MKNITFCEYCREDVGYIVEDKTITSELKSNVYTYVGKVAKCEKCHSEVFVRSAEVDASSNHSLRLGFGS
mgnify:CR=1 FL=1